MISARRLCGPGGVLALLSLGACATQPDYRPGPIAAPEAWFNGTDGSLSPTELDAANWWKALNDPAIDTLVEAALRDNPTLAEAAARVDAARAAVTIRGAAQLPSVGVVGNAGRSQDGGATGGAPSSQTVASLGANLSWEIDLWGRVRAGKEAARSRLAARTADAQAARLSVVGEIADTVISLRACHMTLAIRDEDIASREVELRISRARLSFGNIAPVAVATSDSNLAEARTARVLQRETCLRLINALVAVSGLDARRVGEILPASGASLESTTSTDSLPAPPPSATFPPASASRRRAARRSETNSLAGSLRR